MGKPIVKFEWIKEKSYEDVWRYQEQLQQQLILNKKSNETGRAPIHHLIFTEHQHVYTLGKSGSEEHLLVSKAERESEGIEYFKINRGGDITYHGPGQITGYLIFDMDYFFHDVHKLVFQIEEAVILTLSEYGIDGFRNPKHTGVWVPADSEHKVFNKICAIGIHISRWVTLHGFAFNINTELTKFNHIIPCGIIDQNLGVTSMKNELGKTLEMEVVGERLLKNLQELFQFELQYGE